MNFRNPEGYADFTAYHALCNVCKNKYRPIVYICSHYAGDVESNTLKARRYSRFAVDQGYIPFAPHLLFPQFMNEISERELALFMEIAMLSHCSEVWVFGSNYSKGMASEIKFAKRKNKTIRYFNEDLRERS